MDNFSAISIALFLAGMIVSSLPINIYRIGIVLVLHTIAIYLFLEKSLLGFVSSVFFAVFLTALGFVLFYIGNRTNAKAKEKLQKRREGK